MESTTAIPVKGQYATKNKLFFKGRVSLDTDKLVDVSIYIDKSVTEEELRNLQLLVNFADISQAMKPKR